jgi:hypothetical protein
MLITLLRLPLLLAAGLHLTTISMGGPHTMLIQSARRDKPFHPRIRIGFVVLIDQAMEVLVHVKAVKVILKLLVWIVALLAEVHLGGMNGEHIITVLEDNPTILVQEPSLGLKIWVAHDGILPILRPASECTVRLSSRHNSIGIN